LASLKLRLASLKLRLAGPKFRLAGPKFRLASLKLRLAGPKFRLASLKLRLAGPKFRLASLKLRLAGLKRGDIGSQCGDIGLHMVDLDHDITDLGQQLAQKHLQIVIHPSLPQRKPITSFGSGKIKPDVAPAGRRNVPEVIDYSSRKSRTRAIWSSTIRLGAWPVPATTTTWALGPRSAMA